MHQRCTTAFTLALSTSHSLRARKNTAERQGIDPAISVDIEPSNTRNVKLARAAFGNDLCLVLPVGGQR